jgi:paraquat-inducible protein B
MPQGGRALHLRVGLLVLAGLGLAVGFILYLSAGRFTARQMIFETYITESVAGLDIGAPVRFRGVRIGRVSEIALATAVYGRSTGGSTDAANRLVLIRFAVDPDRYGEGADVAGAVAAGLRVRIASQGVTGISYLEVDFVGDPARAPPIEVPWTPRYPVIPSVPSTITQVTSAAERVMTRLADIDVQALILSATALLDELRALAQGDGDLAVTLREAAQAMRLLREGLQDANLGETVQELRRAAAQLGAAGQSAEALLASPEVANAARNIGQAAAELRTAIAGLPAVIQSLELSLRAIRGTTRDAQADLAPLLRDLRATAASLRDTAEALRRSPSQTLLGAPPPPPRERP